MNVTAFSENCGAVVSDLQLATMSNHELLELRALFAKYGLLFFRDQDLTPDQHLKFANRFGRIVINKFFKTTDDFPQIAEVRKEKTQQTNIGGGWHTDHSYDDIPAMGSILVARRVPEIGGNTQFANLAAAYDALPTELKQRIANLRAVHSNTHLYGENGLYRLTDLSEQLGGMDRVGDATHPVVIIHPESGRRVLYVNPGHTIQIEGWDFTESRTLLDELYAHVIQPQFTCSFNWLPGSVTFWDNRCTWHLANNDYQGHARLMHRITLAGSVLTAA
ncbi:MAG: TauD/TfdA family dioxygenase [Proteobacteria bacterium]|jgi:taurine dioxygenase|uniref:Taurine dioxygenase n=1 Tax=SAR92 bacterium BACL26 MAG-121220-bin70 TaxID=1655626 RepID=A0A0R2U9V6_9GAMM|nr:MAG: taurine dioxygenase [SAR92 bacterium BACL26 MAG-121220-bin70]MDA0795272.1 TauD/TfdA family dioxygenase [Pseudomonadota bacterium]MDA1351414.1 TauD/TfdA family dioxygenase [Pseudomonadota bacterium]|tara:strand:+ start:179 stop:1009 length:831 start_codon:yes stop_codon:yes gene_type:complete